MTINVLDAEETKRVISGEEATDKVSFVGYKTWLKAKYPNSVLYNKYDDQEEINDYLKFVLENNDTSDTVLIPYYEDCASLFPDLTSNYFSGVIVGTDYVEGTINIPLSEVLSSFIKTDLMTGEVFLGNLNLKTLLK